MTRTITGANSSARQAVVTRHTYVHLHIPWTLDRGLGLSNCNTVSKQMQNLHEENCIGDPPGLS